MVLKSTKPVSGRQLTAENMHEHTREAEYAVRGPVANKAIEIQAKLRSPTECGAFSFKNLISCNIGNPQALGQKPITFLRRVAAACTHPPLMDIPGVFPSDVIARAKSYLANTDRGCGTGAYTDTYGLLLVREEVAAFIARRDGYPCSVSNVAITSGASEAVRRVIQALLADSSDGIMISAPQYPLYTCSITMCGGQTVFYNLDESQGWSIDEAELERAYNEAVARGVNVRGIVVINPGNPVGSVLSEETIKKVILFANARNLLIFADEVYQENVYCESKKFISFKKCLCDLDLPGQQLVSFHTVSKGLVGECGQRGGYVEYIGFDDPMMAQFRKLAASALCSNTLGQIFVGLMVNPPKVGDVSYAEYIEETGAISSSLARRAVKLFAALNAIPGISCQPVEGAMYAFPRIEMPASAIAEAKRRNLVPDEMYCLDMVDEIGVVTVPGSGFGQLENTYHFRTTILPSEDEIDDVVTRLAQYNAAFLRKHASTT